MSGSVDAERETPAKPVLQRRPYGGLIRGILFYRRLIGHPLAPLSISGQNGLLSALVLREKLTRRMIAGVCVAVISLVLLA